MDCDEIETEATKTMGSTDIDKVLKKLKNKHTKESIILLDYIDKLEKELQEMEIKRNNGTLSDGYHTYNDLYYQRCILFATICNTHKDISWKSKKHNDGKKCFDSDNWFIVGIDTPEGSYTYHYETKYWDLFEVQELEKGKIWDGHTEKDVTRLSSLYMEKYKGFKRCIVCNKLFIPIRRHKKYCSKKCCTKNYWNNLTIDERKEKNKKCLKYQKYDEKRKEYQKKYRENHKEAKKEYNRRYREKKKLENKE